MYAQWMLGGSKRAGKPQPAGSKIARKAAQGVLTMRAPGGIVSEAFRNTQRREFQAKRAN